MSALPTPPASLKAINHYLKIATEHDVRDTVVAYWARFHAVQVALTLDKSSPEAKTFIIQTLNWLESTKRDSSTEERITVESVAEAYIENYAVKLFNWADDSDRNKNVFNKNVVKAFYTSALLIDILENFGQVSEDFQEMRRYGRWKAAYIHNCLKEGTQPVPGPPHQQDDDTLDVPEFQPEQPQANSILPNEEHKSTTLVDDEERIKKTAEAQKYVKWASSSLNFEDIPAAIENLELALTLLKTL